MDEGFSSDRGFEIGHYHGQNTSISDPPSRSSIENEDIGSQKESSDPGDPHRPNKYVGPPQRWLGWTAAERDISRSVDLMRARDLSLHLYNVHHLRTKAEQLARSEGTSSKTGPSWLSNDWAAWPMTAQDVPRIETGIRRGFVMREDHRFTPDQSRMDLKEALLTCITKAARQRFMDRDYDSHDRSRSSGTSEVRSAEPGIVLSSSSITDSDTGSSSPQETSDQESTQQAQSLKIKRSNSNISLASLHSITSEDENFEPTVMLDDETAMQIAEPSIEHIISSLEQLLQGLHTARQHWPTKRTRSSSNKTKKSTKELTKSKRPSTESSPDDSETTPAPSNTSKPQRGVKRHAQRTWKDILGTAAILGWNSAALRRARDRCSVLFGENMAMPILDFDRGRIPDVQPKQSEYVGEPADEEMFGGVHVDGFLRPIKRRKTWLEGQSEQAQDENAETRAEASTTVQGLNEALEISSDGQTKDSDSERSLELEGSSDEEDESDGNSEEE